MITLRASAPYLIALAILAASTAAGYRAGANAVRLDWERAERKHAQAALERERAYRATEARLTEQMEAIQNDERQKLVELADVLSGVAFERDSLQTALERHRQRAGQDSAAAGSCAPAVAAGELYAQLLAELQELAGDYAQAADRSRLAGSACEAAYSTARGIIPKT